MKPFLITLLMLFWVVSTIGCNVGPDAPKAFQKPVPERPVASESSSDIFVITGTITYVEIEGGFFTIDGDDGSKYDPVNLPDAFRKDGLHVKATVRLRTDVMSVHMHGKIIEIVDITAQ